MNDEIEDLLRAENARLRDEIHTLRAAITLEIGRAHV